MPSSSEFSMSHWEGNGARSNGATRNDRRSRGGSNRPTGIDDDDLSIHDIFDILIKGKWLILGTFLLVLSLAVAYTITRDPEYEAATSLLIEKQQSSQLGEMLGVQSDNRNIQNEIEIIRSRTLALQVADRLLLERVVPGSTEPLTILNGSSERPALTRLDVANRLRTRYIRVQQRSREIDFVSLIATSTIPEEAALIANVYAEEYVEYNRTSSRSRMTATREFLADVTGRFQNDLEMAEDDLSQFLHEEALVAPTEEATALINQISQTQQLQYEAQARLGMVQAEIGELEAEVERVRPGLAQRIASSDDVVIDRLVREIAELEFRIEQKYATSPTLRTDPSQDAELSRLLSQHKALSEEIQDRATRLVSGSFTSGGAPSGGEDVISSTQERLTEIQVLRSELLRKRIEMKGLNARLRIGEDQLIGARSRLNTIPRKEVILNRLERSLESREQLYIALIERLQEARIAEQSELGYVSIVDEAILPVTPVRPQKARNVLVAAMLGIFLGFILAFARNQIDNKIRRPEDLRSRGYSVLGAVPDLVPVIKSDFDGEEFVTVDGHRFASTMITLLNPLSPMAEAYRRLRTNLQFSRPDADLKAVLITSSIPGEGKTVTAVNLAISMAQSGLRTVYVDADLRRPRGHRVMGLAREPGMVDMIFDYAPADPNGEGYERFATPIDDLYVIPAGATVPNPSEIIGSSKMRGLIERLKSDFDFIVIDTPPVLAVADALSISGLTDLKLLVCSAGETTWTMVESASEAFSFVDEQITGIVLNRFDERAAYGGYGYGYGMTEYYGETVQQHRSVP